MSRQEDFQTQAEIYANKCGGTTQEKCATMTDYFAGAEYGYQYAKKRLSKVLGFELDFNVAEFDDGVTTESLVDKICKRMEK